MKELTIVTGASSNHFQCLKNLLYTVSIFDPEAQVVIYDLGLKPAENVELKCFGYKICGFPYENYPPYINIQIASGQYAWKPIILARTLREAKGMVLWLDAGNLISEKLVQVRNVLFEHGVYSPVSSGTIIRWTHPKTLEYLRANPGLLSKRNRNAAIVGLNASNPNAIKLAELWEQCALDVNCIAPEGSNRTNHRQDQAVLSVLIYQIQEMSGFALVDDRLGISIHNDKLSFDEVCNKYKR